MKKLAMFFGWIVCLIAAGCGASGVRTGQPAPAFELPDIKGKTHSLKDYEGQTLTLLHFWTDWCDACRREFPKIEKYYRDLHPQGLEVLAVNLGQEKSVSVAFQQEFDVSFPMLVDEQQKLQPLYGIEVFPTNFLINGKGEIIREIRGWADATTVEGILQSMKANQ